MDDNSPQIAPNYGHHRRAVSVADTLPETNLKHGINMGAYKTALIQVVPAAAANPTITILFWSQAAGKFIRRHTALTFAGLGADVPYEVEVEVDGRIMFVALSGTLTDGVDVYVSGYGLNHTL